MSTGNCIKLTDNALPTLRKAREAWEKYTATGTNAVEWEAVHSHWQSTAQMLAHMLLTALDDVERDQ